MYPAGCLLANDGCRSVLLMSCTDEGSVTQKMSEKEYEQVWVATLHSKAGMYPAGSCIKFWNI
jgi:hypothetical protein